MVSEKILFKLVVLGALIVAVLTVLAALPGRDPAESAFASQKKTTEGEDGNKKPLAVYSAQLPSEPAERAIRLARSGRFDKRFTVPFDEASPDTTGRSSINDWYLQISALPAAQSDLVVIGQVTSAIGYLSNDRTGAYSEFTVQINEVLKDDGSQSVQSIIAVREGADVQLPSGRIIRYEILHQGMPLTGRQYVLFLKHNEQGNDYTILTGYELRENRVFPLDQPQQFAIYETYSESAFLNAVREAIALHVRKGG
ncbi:MAG: hypothetical protein AABO41_10745 [Acidobacteriota bacterium]